MLYNLAAVAGQWKAWRTPGCSPGEDGGGQEQEQEQEQKQDQEQEEEQAHEQRGGRRKSEHINKERDGRKSEHINKERGRKKSEQIKQVHNLCVYSRPGDRVWLPTGQLLGA